MTRPAHPAARQSHAPTRTLEPARLLAGLGHWSRGTGPLYLRLARALRRAIDRGDLPPLTRLPAERALAAALLVSRGTVVAAYEQLCAEGLLDSREGSGTWVRLEAARPVTLLNDYAPDSRARGLSGRLFDRDESDPTGAADDTVDLAIAAFADLDGLPAALFDLPEPAELARLGGHGYRPLGLPALRSRVAGWFARDGVPTGPGQVAVTAGAQQAISLVAQLLLRPGDAVVVEVPTYPGALDVFTRSGAWVVPVPAGAPFPALRDAVAGSAARLVYVQPACSNPEARVTPAGRRRELARLADEQNVYVLEDNILADVVFDGRRVPPVASFSRSGRVLSLGSLSKVAWGGLRIGWVRGPAGFVDALGRLQAAADFGLSPLPQLVAVNILDRLDEVAALRGAQLRERRDLARAELARLLPEWTWEEPDGGLSLWVQLPFGTADGFAQLALRHGVDVTPGGAHTVDGGCDDRLRLSYAARPELLRVGIARLAAAWCEYAGTLTRRAS